MGRVIKGSPDSEDRYTLAVPALVAVPAAGLLGNAEEPELLDLPVELSQPPEPAIDLEAVQAQAQELLDAAERNAQALVDEAQERARVMLDEAEKRVEVLAEDARRGAHDEGYANGVLEAQTAMTEMIKTMSDLIASTRSERHAMLRAAEPELVKLAVGIAERVLHQQIALDPSVVVEMAKAAIARIIDREKITVRVNPADVERMREHRDELLGLGDVKSMRVIEDQRVDRGGVILETDAGSIDAKISTQLTEVRKILHVVDDVVAQPAADEEPPLTAVRAS